MNYLAHLYLADPTPDSLLGNLLADFVKGNEVAQLPPAIQAGVRLHRQLDSFTDRHSLVQRSIGRISESWHWFSGILIDVYYDHILALDWDRYAREPLRQFTDRVHRCLNDNIDRAPPASRELIKRMIESDRLQSYATIEGITEALVRLSRRIRERIPKREVRLELAVPLLQENHAVLCDDFHEFFPQLVEFARNQKLLADT
jgi:acyl carrier protein phosphodiesterase